MEIEINDLETGRFGIVCARFRAGETLSYNELVEMNRQAREAGVRMVSTRVDVGALAQVHALEADGFRLMDTIVYFGGPLRPAIAGRSAPDGVTFRQARSEDAPAVAAIARRAFEGYIGHYHADPRLDRSAADAAYVEWAETSIARPGPDDRAFVATRGATALGFLTVRSLSCGACEIVLNAVDPACQGQGIYRALLRATREMFDGPDDGRLSVSTQINNYTVQRIWSREGLVHERSSYTFHKWFD